MELVPLPWEAVPWKRREIISMPRIMEETLSLIGSSVELRRWEEELTTDNVTESDGVSHTAHIHEGYLKILTERRFSFTATAEREALPYVIEQPRNSSLNYDTEHAVPVYEGRALPHACCYLAEHLTKFLTEQEYSFTASAVRELARDFQERL